LKKTIAHIIFDLGRGGAETMLVTVVKELTEYNNVVITLFDSNHFGNEFKCDRYISLRLKLWHFLFFPIIAWRLRRVLKQVNPQLIHTHLFWPTVLARLTMLNNIPLVTTIHAFVAQLVDYKKWHLKWLDKLTYRLRNNHIIAVAKGALDEYFSFLKLKPYKAWHLYTFVDTRIFNSSGPKTAPGPVFKLISVGALRIQKNQAYLIDAMAQLKDLPIELHIYGSGPLQQALQQQIDSTGAKVVLKGQVDNIQQVIPQYDAFVMSSTYEGFSLAVLEAMALELPLLLSDIASFREQCEDVALYFSLQNPAQLAVQVQQLAGQPAQLAAMGQAGKQRALQNFTLPHHLAGLRSIYRSILEPGSGSI
jgi:glycosyltransferase involved in cell wall biosynthesis